MLTPKQQFIRDGIIFGFSILIAAVLIKTQAVQILIANSSAYHYLGSLLSGFFFTSIFTSAPATVALGEIAQTTHPYLVAALGAFGALAGDLLLFRFFRHHVTRDLRYIISLIKLEERTLAKAHMLRELTFFKDLMLVLGAVVIASPLPDELGLMLWGISHIKTRTVVILTLTLNFVGILIIALVGRAIA